MALQVGLLREAFAAQRARVLAMIRVGLRVHLQVILPREGLVAMVTLEFQNFVVRCLQTGGTTTHSSRQNGRTIIIMKNW